MPSIQIKIGASLDADVNALFTPIEARAERARARIAEALGAGLRDGFAKAGASELADAVADAIKRGLQQGFQGVGAVLGRAARGGGGGGGAAGAGGPVVAPARGGGGAGPYRSPGGLLGPSRDEMTAITRDVERNARARVLAERAAMREVERDLAEHNRNRLRAEQEEAAAEARDRAQKAQQQRRVERQARRVVSAVGAAAGRVLSTAGGFAGDVARGAGVRFDVGSYVAQNVEAQKIAQDIANSGWMPGAKGPAGVHQAGGDIAAEAMAAANVGGTSQAATLEGLQAFVGKTGDLETGRKVLAQMAVLARATGGDLKDYLDAAGDASANLGDNFKSADDKANAVASVMRAMAGQGKLGAVEVRDMATQMAKIAATSGAFAGDRSENMAMMGALAQEARARGGAASATQAATSVQGFLQILTTPARVKAFKAAGVETIDKASGKMRSPEEIIVDALTKTKGDQIALKKMFANTSGARPVMGFANVYREAGGGAAGIAAVREEFDRLKKAAMGQGEVTESYLASMKGVDAQTQLFNNKLQELTGRLQAEVIPKFVALGPALVSALDWTASNPGKAAATALAASIAKAGVEKVLSEGISTLISKAGAQMGLVGLAITAAAVTLYATSVILDKDKEAKTSQRERLEGLLGQRTERDTARLGMGQSRLEEARRAKEQADADVAAAEAELAGAKPGAASAAAQAKLGAALGRQGDAAQAASEAEGEIKAAKAAIETDKQELEHFQTSKERVDKEVPGAASWYNSFFSPNDDTKINRGTVAESDAAKERLDAIHSQLEKLNEALTGRVQKVELVNVPEGPRTTLSPPQNGRTGPSGF